jgi:hypothetical protein
MEAVSFLGMALMNQFGKARSDQVIMKKAHQPHQTFYE